MEETASICTYATNRSLVILDEVGRGTSTFDGLAIAHAVVEYIYTNVGARCLFATHYHELTQLHTLYRGIVPFYAASKKTDAGIIFLYKMIHGSADGSFGIEVAKLARIPKPIIDRAEELLSAFVEKEKTGISGDQMRIIEENKKLHTICAQSEKTRLLIEQLQQMNIDEMSAKQALDLLWQWKQEYSETP